MKQPKPLPVKAVPAPSDSGFTPGLQAEAYAQNFGVNPTSMIWYDPMTASNMIIRNIVANGKAAIPSQSNCNTSSCSGQAVPNTPPVIKQSYRRW